MASLHDLNALGQSIWLDYIRRDTIENGELARLVEQGLRGVTSNPSIFEKAIGGSDLYVNFLKEAGAEGGDAEAIYERIAIRDIQDAADVLRPVYEATQGHDGFVSLEVSPHLAHEYTRTVSEAKRLWEQVQRPNLMIKVPGTPAGAQAFGDLIRAGINVNVTLLFSVKAYRLVAETFIDAIAARVAAGADVSKVASVASFFVSRIDAAVDAALETQGASGLAGKTAIANAKLAYEVFGELFAAPRWKALAAKGAQAQRVLWASTGTKNPNYSDVLYVDELIGPQTVNTVPPATLQAFMDHGRLSQSLMEDLNGAKAALKAIAEAGVNLETVTDRLLEEGVQQFIDAYDKLLDAVRARIK